MTIPNVHILAVADIAAIGQENTFPGTEQQRFIAHADITAEVAV